MSAASLHAACEAPMHGKSKLLYPPVPSLHAY